MDLDFCAGWFEMFILFLIFVFFLAFGDQVRSFLDKPIFFPLLRNLTPFLNSRLYLGLGTGLEYII